MKDGCCLEGGILKVDSFINQQIDTRLLKLMAEEFVRRFSSLNINKILTVESSGIAIAFAAAQFFRVPVVFAKKGAHKNVGADVYTGECFSYTKGTAYEMSVSKAYLGADDRVLIIDDFLANGAATKCLLHIMEQAGAKLVGIGIAIEKGFQPGGAELRNKGIRVESLAIVESMDDYGHITFRS